MDSTLPDTHLDHALAAISIVFTIPFIISNCVLIVHRHRDYFRAQGGVSLIVGSSAAGLLWSASTFVNNGHFTQVGLLRNCRLWMFWLQSLGFGLWFMLTFFRLRCMYELCHSVRTWQCREYTAFALVFFFPIIAMDIAAFFGDFDAELDGKHYCRMSRGWNIARIFVYFPYWILGVGIMCKLQNQQDPFLAAEYTDTFDYLALGIFVCLIYLFALLTGVSRIATGRCLLTVSQVSILYFPFWIRFGWPVYLCLFRPKQEMDQFEQKLRDSGTRALHMANGRQTYLPSSEGAVWEAFAEAEKELVKYKDEIQKLEAQKLLLTESIRKLRQQQKEKSSRNS